MARMLIASDVQSMEQSFRFDGLQRDTQRIRKMTSSSDTSGYSRRDVPAGHSEIYVSLGALDTYNPVTAVNLSAHVSPEAYTPQREADFQVEIRAIGGNASSHALQLPVLEDMANKPWRFLTNDPSNFKLAFNIYHSRNAIYRGDRLVGSAVALLGSLKQGFGSKRESLIRDFTIPILHKDTLDFLGTVTFYFVVSTPFPHPCPMPRVEQRLGRHEGNPKIIGHRGKFRCFI